MFHKCIADGKKLFLWISDLKWATRSLVSWPQVGVWGEDESSVSGFGVRQVPTNLYSVAFLFEVH